jgi:hypothetical protein
MQCTSCDTSDDVNNLALLVDALAGRPVGALDHSTFHESGIYFYHSELSNQLTN